MDDKDDGEKGKVLSFADRKAAKDAAARRAAAPNHLTLVPKVESLAVLHHPLAAAIISEVQKQLPSAIFLDDLPRVGEIRTKLLGFPKPKNDTLMERAREIAKYDDAELKQALRACTDADLQTRPAYYQALCDRIMDRTGSFFDPPASP